LEEVSLKTTILGVKQRTPLFINAVTGGTPLARRINAALAWVARECGLTMATGILVAQYAGARNWQRLRGVVQTSTALCILISAVLLPLGELLTPTILKGMQTAPDVLPMAVSYMRIFLLTLPFNFGIYLVVSMLRGVGDSKTPLYFQTGALLLTAVLDPILMFGLLGFPRMGLNGTAVAAVTMQALGLAATFYYLHRKSHVVAPDWGRLRIDWPMAGLLLKIGFPSAVHHSLVSLGMLFVTGFVNAYGENATAAFGAVMRIDQLAFLPAMTFSMAVTSMVGQNIGARRLDRVPQVFGWGMVLSGSLALLATLVAVAAPRVILRMFVNDPEVMRIGVGYLSIVGLGYIFLSTIFIGNGVLNGAGHTFITTATALFSLWVVRVPLAIYLPRHMGGVEGIWWAMLISSAATAALSLAFYYAGLWKRPVGARHLEEKPAAPEEIAGHGGSPVSPVLAEEFE
jgi:putative MATE family efflux protein